MMKTAIRSSKIQREEGEPPRLLLILLNGRGVQFESISPDLFLHKEKKNRRECGELY